MKYKSRADLLIAAGESIKTQEKAGIEPVCRYTYQPTNSIEPMRISGTYFHFSITLLILLLGIFVTSAIAVYMVMI